MTVWTWHFFLTGCLNTTALLSHWETTSTFCHLCSAINNPQSRFQTRDVMCLWAASTTLPTYPPVSGHALLQECRLLWWTCTWTIESKWRVRVNHKSSSGMKVSSSTGQSMHSSLYHTVWPIPVRTLWWLQRQAQSMEQEFSHMWLIIWTLCWRNGFQTCVSVPVYNNYKLWSASRGGSVAEW